MSDVYQDIKYERTAQDAKWGGQAHDDEHSPEDWISFMETKLDQAYELIGTGEPDSDAMYRRRMVQVAALAVAAIDAIDRARAPR